VTDFSEAKIYLAGSPAMVEAVSAAMLERGLPPGDVHADAFYAPKPARTAAATVCSAPMDVATGQVPSRHGI